jgi:PAS domain S-box-containing protein
MTTATLLIVEDDGILAANLESIIRELGYSVLGPVPSGEEAIDLLQKHVADLVLMDIELAGALNGIETAERIGHSRDIPIVFLTGFSHDPLLDQAKIVAPYGYLVKPVPERELAATVTMSLHRHALDRELRESRKALAASEARYRYLFEQSPVGIFRISLEGRILLTNLEFAKMLGCASMEEAVATFTDLKHQLFADPDSHQRFVNLLHIQGEVKLFNCQWQKKDGPLIWISMNARLSAAGAETGDLAVIDGFALDITEHKRAEKELQESEEKYRLLHESAGLGIGYYTPDGVVVSYNEIASRHMNGRPEDFKGKSIHDLFPKEAALVYMDRIKKAIISEAPQVYEDRVELLKKITWYLSTFTRILDSNGILLGVQIISNDITEHKQAEIALRQSEEKFRLLVNTAPFGIQLTDLEGKIVYSNPAHHKIQGYKPNELIGMYIWDLMANDSHRAVAKQYYQTIISENPEPTMYFNRDKTKDGREIDVQVNWDYVHNDKGQISGLISIIEDITERKRAEEEKKILNAQLQQAQKLEAIGTLAGGIAHDFNNILGAIVGYSEMIRDDSPPGSPSIHDINQVIKASHRAKDLVKQILAFSRQVENQKIPMQPAVIVKEAITLLRSSLPTTITISQDIDPEAGVVLADPTHIHQIVMNLATNAFHAMEVKGGMLTISLQKKILSRDDLATIADLQPGTFVQLSIKDTGEGILPEIRERIFDPFFTTKEVGKGTGLGLSMVYRIVKSCNGSIACNSRLGEGAEFCILLPALEGHAIEENGSTGHTPHGKEHILLIDDEEILAELGQAMLIRLGYHVTTRTNSLDALATFQNQPDTFDLIITDQTMPGMTGVDLARRILQIRPEVPIILCTGYSSLISEDKAKALGIKGFAVKPLAKKDIGELIRKVLDGKTRDISTCS